MVNCLTKALVKLYVIAKDFEVEKVTECSTCQVSYISVGQ